MYVGASFAHRKRGTLDIVRELKKLFPTRYERASW